MSYTVYQCTRFCEDPKILHTQAVEYIGKYLMGTRNQGIFIQPKNNHFFMFMQT